MLPEIPIQLTGRVGSWRPRHVRDQARSVWSVWLRTAQQGTIGIYVLAKPGVRLVATLPNGAWVRVRGTIRPLRVQALGDDPRAVDDLASTPLLVHVYQVRRVRRTDSTPPLLAASVALQVRPGVQTVAGELAPVAHLPDLYHLTANGQACGQVRPWSRLRGVVALVGPHRFVRYVVTEGRT
jgi:hypothetical protein